MAPHQIIRFFENLLSPSVDSLQLPLQHVLTVAETNKKTSMRFVTHICMYVQNNT